MIVAKIYHSHSILFPAVFKIKGIVKVHLGCSPGIAQLHHNQHSDLVTGVKNCFTCRKMRASYGIVASLLQLFYASVGKGFMLYRTNNSVIVVDTSSAELYAFAIQAQASLGIK